MAGHAPRRQLRRSQALAGTENPSPHRAGGEGPNASPQGRGNGRPGSVRGGDGHHTTARYVDLLVRDAVGHLCRAYDAVVSSLEVDGACKGYDAVRIIIPAMIAPDRDIIRRSVDYVAFGGHRSDVFALLCVTQASHGKLVRPEASIA